VAQTTFANPLSADFLCFVIVAFVGELCHTSHQPIGNEDPELSGSRNHIAHDQRIRVIRMIFVQRAFKPLSILELNGSL